MSKILEILAPIINLIPEVEKPIKKVNEEDETILLLHSKYVNFSNILRLLYSFSLDSPFPQSCYVDWYCRIDLLGCKLDSLIRCHLKHWRRSLLLVESDLGF